MSIKLMSEVFGLAIEPGPKVTLLALADFADDDGYCWPSWSKIAQKTATSRATVSRHIKKLTELGYITVEKRLRPDGSQSSNGYRIGGLNLRPGGITVDTGGGITGDTGGGITVDTPNEPSLLTANMNHHNNPPIVPPCDEAVEAFNEMARETGLATVQKLTAKRRKALHKRLEDAGGMDGWRHAMDLIRRSDFLRGENSRGWRATFDFILREDKFTSLMEGAYNRNEQESTRNIFDRVYAELGVSRD